MGDQHRKRRELGRHPGVRECHQTVRIWVSHSSYECRTPTRYEPAPKRALLSLAVSRYGSAVDVLPPDGVNRNAGVPRRRLSALMIALRDAVVMFESRPTPQVVPCSALTSM